MADVQEIIIPLPSKPQHLKMVFNNSALMLIEEKTGKSPLSLMENQEELRKTKTLIAILFAGTRKHHTRNPGVSEEQLLEWLDEIDPNQLLGVYGQIIKVYIVSFLPREKRDGFLRDMEAKQKQATETLNKTDMEQPMKVAQRGLPPTNDGKPTSSMPSAQA